jgi:hypothetical protein
VADATLLTQFGRKTELFRNAPRIERELGVSLLMGEQTAEEALRYVLQGKLTYEAATQPGSHASY